MPSEIRRLSSAALLVAAVLLVGSCASSPETATQGPELNTPPTVSAPLGAPDGTETPMRSQGGGSPTTAAAPSTSGAPLPSPTSAYGCPRGPCPSSLEYAVNGCDCAGQIYEDSKITESFCCKSGFSNQECPEALQQQAVLESIFGATEGEVEAQLVTVKLQGWPAQVHEKAAPAFRRAAAAIENMSYRIQEPVGSYSYRVVQGHVALSLHSFGIAVDINPSANPSCGVTQACRCYNDLVTDMPAEFVQAFKDAGFDWGGDWVDHPDPMHFEWAAWRQGAAQGP